jgi:hypothetical protein
MLDDPDLAVGNALGEGIVIRDGPYNSAMPEEQGNWWKWIRFSVAHRLAWSGAQQFAVCRSRWTQMAAVLWILSNYFVAPSLT